MAEMTVASTTDTQKDIDAAAGVPEEESPVKVESNEIEAEPEAEAKKEDSEPKPSKSGFQKRIDKLTRTIHEKDRDNAELRARLEKLEQRFTEPAKKEEPVKAEAEPNAKPKQEDFQDYDAYVEALADWKTEQKLAAKLEEFKKFEEEEAAKQEQKAVFDAYNKRCDDAREKYEDFDDVAFSNSIDVPNAVLQVIQYHDNGPDLQYYIGSHKDFARKLVAMPPAMALVEVGKLMDKFAAEAEPTEEAKAPRKSNAPAPIKPIGGSSTKSSISIDEMEYQDYRKAREQQIKNKYRR